MVFARRRYLSRIGGALPAVADQSMDLAGLPRTPERVLDLLEPNKLLSLLRDLRTPEATRLSTHVSGLGQFEREGVAGFRARFGLVVEGITGPNLGPGLILEDAIQAD